MKKRFVYIYYNALNDKKHAYIDRKVAIFNHLILLLTLLFFSLCDINNLRSPIAGTAELRFHFSGGG